MLSSKSFMTLAVIFRLLFHFVQIFCILHETGIQLHSQSYGSTVVLATAAEEILLSLFNGFVTPVKKSQLAIDVWLYLWTFYFVPLIQISVFVPVPYCLDDCGLVVGLEVRQVDSSTSILLSQDCFGYSRFFFFCISIQIVEFSILVM